MTNPMFSIIVPVYNTEKYLDDCINSIIDAKIESCEIILVDDGSTDESGMICDSLEKKFNNIKVIHKLNGGLSSARNAGIKIAKGKYLMFVDSDDKINKFDFKKYLKNNVDFIQYKMIYLYENEKLVYLKNIDLSCGDNLIGFLYNQVKNGTLSISACDKIVSRKMVVENNLYFEEGLFSEDINWSLELYLVAKSFKAYNDEIYVYRQQRIGSITNSTNNKKISSLIYILKKWTTRKYESDDIKKVYMNYLAYLFCILITISNKNNTTNEQKKYIKEKVSILRNDCNYKTKYCYKVIKIFGFKIGTFILKVYLFLKNKGLIKL